VWASRFDQRIPNRSPLSVAATALHGWATGGASASDTVLPCALAATTSCRACPAKQLSMGCDTLLIGFCGLGKGLHRWNNSTNDVLPNPLLVIEFGEARSEAKDIDDAQTAIGFHQSRRTIFTVLIQEPVRTHARSSRRSTHGTPPPMVRSSRQKYLPMDKPYVSSTAATSLSVVCWWTSSSRSRCKPDGSTEGARDKNRLESSSSAPPKSPVFPGPT
jgi:hypothetical protein